MKCVNHPERAAHYITEGKGYCANPVCKQQALDRQRQAHLRKQKAIESRQGAAVKDAPGGTMVGETRRGKRWRD